MCRHLAGCAFRRQPSTALLSHPPLLPVKDRNGMFHNSLPPGVFQNEQGPLKYVSASTRTWLSTIHSDMAVFPSKPGRNRSVAVRGLMLEMTKLDGAPGSSVNRKKILLYSKLQRTTQQYFPAHNKAKIVIG